jgi:hypothetical protein
VNTSNNDDITPMPERMVKQLGDKAEAGYEHVP